MFGKQVLSFCIRHINIIRILTSLLSVTSAGCPPRLESSVCPIILPKEEEIDSYHF